jgi:putative protease
VSFFTPELLSPAGSLEKLKVAVLYGADAVYLGGTQLGLRQGSDNFDDDELVQGVAFAHAHGTRVYMVLNAYPFEEEVEALPAYLKHLEKVGIDAVIASDLGVIETVRSHSNIPVHLSTQASCLSVASAKFWKSAGVKRVVLGREVTIAEAGRIKDQAQVEVEMFVHGSMCMSYSGHCVISNYTQGRDSNRGGCGHSCRHEYGLSQSESEKRRAFFMSSKDLKGLALLEEFARAGIDSLKIEGRMKTPHYAATVTKVYADALAHFKSEGHLLSENLEEWDRELGKVSHRDYFEGSLREAAGPEGTYLGREHEEPETKVAATVIETREGKGMIALVRGAFHPGDELELLPFKGPAIHFRPSEVLDLSGQIIERTKPGTLVRLPQVAGAHPHVLIRRAK